MSDQEEPSTSGQAAEAKAEDAVTHVAKTNRKLSDKKLQKLKDKLERRGVVYFSRLPPHLKPLKLRHMLEQYAKIGRIYLAAEDDATRRKRKQRGGNSGKNFTEGWVEFEDKGEAKSVAAQLNGQPMGGRRLSAHYYDLWCMKYLPKFKWDHLTEEINYQRAVREQRLAAEVSAANRDRDFYLSRVDRAKGVEAILERKKKKARAEEGGGSGGQGKGPGDRAGSSAGGGGGGASEEGPRVLRTYGQRKAKADPVTDADAPGLSQGLLRLIAGQKDKAKA